jgi:hypothetical protein
MTNDELRMNDVGMEFEEARHLPMRAGRGKWGTD